MEAGRNVVFVSQISPQSKFNLCYHFILGAMDILDCVYNSAWICNWKFSDKIVVIDLSQHVCILINYPLFVYIVKMFWRGHRHVMMKSAFALIMNDEFSSLLVISVVIRKYTNWHQVIGTY